MRDGGHTFFLVENFDGNPGVLMGAILGMFISLANSRELKEYTDECKE